MSVLPPFLLASFFLCPFFLSKFISYFTFCAPFITEAAQKHPYYSECPCCQCMLRRPCLDHACSTYCIRYSTVLCVLRRYTCVLPLSYCTFAATAATEGVEYCTMFCFVAIQQTPKTVSCTGY
eukprot:4659398-Pleurochrysis_carterae.AAC.1